MTADCWLLAAPVAGTAVNFAAQVMLARILPANRLLLLIVAAFGIGLAVTAAMSMSAILREDAARFDALALVASVLFIYSAAGLVLFAIVNLGETSLRIRMMRVLRDTPDGVRREELISAYD